MSITKTPSNTYRVEVFYPKELRALLDAKGDRYRETVKTKAETTRKEREIQRRIKEAKQKQTERPMELKGKILFKDFYANVFMPLYLSGSTGHTHVVPTPQTVQFQRSLFKNHLIPMFGEFSIAYLNNHKEFIINKIVKMSSTYANIRTVRSYVHQMFKTAEILDYVEYDRVSAPLARIASPHKDKLKKEREAKGLALSATELLAWLNATHHDYEKGKMALEDYLLFLLTLHLGDRKSESYGLQWKHIDIERGVVYMVQALTFENKPSNTKGHKQSIMPLPKEVLPLILEWKDLQAKQLKEIGVEQTADQFVFTYTNSKGGMNMPLYKDYLNNKLKTVRRHYPELVYLHPHKLRHTFSTLARQGGATMEQISEAFTHSRISTTRTYVNTPDVIENTVHKSFMKRLNSIKLKRILLRRVMMNNRSVPLFVPDSYQKAKN
jgi:integrase